MSDVPSAMMDNREEERNEALAIAAQEGDLDKAKALIAKGANPRIASNEYASPPLCRATFFNQFPMVEYLLGQGAPIDELDPMTGMSPLQIACRRGYTDIARFLLEKGSNPYILSKKEIDTFAIAVLYRRREIQTMLPLYAQNFPKNQKTQSRIL